MRNEFKSHIMLKNLISEYYDPTLNDKKVNFYYKF